MLNSFWHRWRIEVLHVLQTWAKWLEPNKNLQINDVVIITDDLTTLKRPVIKLILLHVNHEAVKSLVQAKE